MFDGCLFISYFIVRHKWMHNFKIISHKLCAVVDNRHLVNLENLVQQNPVNTGPVAARSKA